MYSINYNCNIGSVERRRVSSESVVGANTSTSTQLPTTTFYIASKATISHANTITRLSSTLYTVRIFSRAFIFLLWTTRVL